MCGWKMRRRQSLQNNSIIDRVSAGNKGPVLWVLIKDPRRRRKMEKDKKRRGSKAAESRRSFWEIKGSPSFSHTQKKKSLRQSHGAARCFDVHLSGCRVAASQVFCVLAAVGRRGFGDYAEKCPGKKQMQKQMVPCNKTHFRDFRRLLVSVLNCFALKAPCVRFSAI